MRVLSKLELVICAALAGVGIIFVSVPPQPMPAASAEAVEPAAATNAPLPFTATTSPAEPVPYRLILSDFRDTIPPAPGTLRWAIECLDGPRVITFAVPGTIQAASNNLAITDPWVTLDGAGSTLNGCELAIAGTHHVTLRNLRVREGAGKTQAQVDTEAKLGGCRSVLVIDSPDKPCEDILIENCSVEDSTDDNGSTWDYYGPGCRRIEWRYCIFAGGRLFKVGQGTDLPDSEPMRDRPTKGFLAGAGSEHGEIPPPDDACWLSVHHNLFIDCYERMPRFSGKTFAFYDNVIIREQWPPGVLDGCGDVVNNWCEYRGPMLSARLPFSSQVYEPRSLFVAGNYCDGQPCNPFARYNSGGAPLPLDTFRATRWRPFTPEGAFIGRARVLYSAGCRPPDARDAELIAKARATPL